MINMKAVEEATTGTAEVLAEWRKIREEWDKYKIKPR